MFHPQFRGSTTIACSDGVGKGYQAEQQHRQPNGTPLEGSKQNNGIGYRRSQSRKKSSFGTACRRHARKTSRTIPGDPNPSRVGLLPGEGGIGKGRDPRRKTEGAFRE